MSIDYGRLRELRDECTTGQWQSHDYEPDHRVPVALAILAQIEKEQHRHEH